MTDEARVPVHPLTGFLYWRKLQFLLLLPLLRAMLSQESLTLLLSGEAALLAALIGYGILRQRQIRFDVRKGNILLERGLLVKRSAVIPLAALRVVTIEKGPVAAALGAEKVTLNTGAGQSKRPDFVFYLPTKAEAAFLEALALQEPAHRIFRPRGRQVILVSLSNASALSGLLVAATLLRRGGKLLDREWESQVVDTLSRVAAVMRWLIPPATTALAVLLVVGFGVSFFQSLRRSWFFTVSSSRRTAAISRGLWRQNTAWFPRQKPFPVALEHPPLMSLIRRCSARLCVSAQGREEAEHPLLVPADRREEAEATLRLIGVGDGPTPLTHPVPLRAKKRAQRLPLLTAIALALATTVGCARFPSLRGLIGPAGLFGTGVAGYWLWLRLRHAKQGGAALGSRIRVVGIRRLTLVDSRFPLAEVDAITVTQGPFDRRRGLCTLRVSQRDKGGYTAQTPNLEYAEVLRALAKTE